MSAGGSPDAEIRVRRVPGTSRRIRVYASDGDAGLTRMLYWPSRRRAALAFGAGRLAHRLRLTPSDSLDLTETGASPDETVDQFVVVDTPGHHRRVVGLARSGRLLAVAKIGDPDGRLENEAMMLPIARDRLRGSVVVPELLGERVTSGRAALLQRALEGRAGREGIALEEGVAVALALARADLTHDDLVPWNLIRTSAGLGLYDWEYAHVGSRPGRDLAHFIVQQGLLLGRWSPARCAELLVGRDGPGADYAAALGLERARIRTEVRSYLEDPPGSCERAAWTDRFRHAVAIAVKSDR